MVDIRRHTVPPMCGPSSMRIVATYRRPVDMPLVGSSSSRAKRLRWPRIRRLWDRKTARLRMDASIGAWGRTPPSLAGPPKAPVNLALVGVLGHGKGTPSCSRSKASWAATKGRKQFLAWTPGLNRFQRLVVTSQSPPSHITPTFCLAIHPGGVQGSVPVTAEADGSSPRRPTTSPLWTFVTN